MKSKLIEKSAAINNKIAPVITLDLFDSLICCLSDFFLMSLVIFDLEKKSSGQARGFAILGRRPDKSGRAAFV